jgi:hypothetical protein
MIGLATAALLDAGVKDPRAHLFVADIDLIAPLMFSKASLSEERLRILHEEADRGRFRVIFAPDQPHRPIYCVRFDSDEPHGLGDGW